MEITELAKKLKVDVDLLPRIILTDFINNDKVAFKNKGGKYEWVKTNRDSLQGGKINIKA